MLIVLDTKMILKQMGLDFQKFEQCSMQEGTSTRPEESEIVIEGVLGKSVLDSDTWLRTTVMY